MSRQPEGEADVVSAENESAGSLVAWKQEKEFRLSSVFTESLEAKLACTGLHILRVFSQPPILDLAIEGKHQ